MLLINADDICKECIDELLVGTCEACVIKEHKINKAVDAVIVIRCSECVHSFGVTDQDGRRQLCCTEIGKRGLRDDDYCSFGKRRKQHEDQKT